MKKLMIFYMIIFIGLSFSACAGKTTLPAITISTNESTTTITTSTWTTEDLTTTEPDEFVFNLLESLTLREKASQMVQAERSSITNEQVTEFGIGSILSGGGSHPTAYDDSIDTWYNMYSNYQAAALNSSSGIPIIYGIDAVHGNNNLYGATIFPHNIGLGMANNPELVYNISKATAEEMLVTGINWTFAPAFSVVQNISWGRTYEGYSENPEIHINLAQAAILGFEENDVSATAKHFLGDGGTLGGVDQGNVEATESLIRELYLAPYYEAVAAGVDTIMISYNSINGIKMHGYSYWINDVLKEEMGFAGFIISDWNAIHQLPGSYYDQVVTSINAGVDMLMEPYDWAAAIDNIVTAVNSNDISIERIDDAVRRILIVKYQRGLFEGPFNRLDSSYLYSQEHQELARQAARESLVLLKNDNNTLPLSKAGNLFISGPVSDNVGLLCGGWTTYWQGNDQADIGVGTSILDAMTAVINNNSGTLSGDWQTSDTVVVVLAENPYSEGAGDNNNLTLTGGNAHPANYESLLLAQAAHNAGKNVVGILISGRPLLLENYLQYFDSFVAAWLPGSEGGLAISDVLFGDYDFVGKLSFTWPADISQVGYTSNREDYDEDYPLFPYGYGLRYN
ncbi:MAG: glycoside hydrolase family 3 protein [Candidatus Izemoplasmatales bacterium]|nr:glycoside hydrolase family 3 protein [Candidatus Izemoplasmatales bacterium]